MSSDICSKTLNYLVTLVVVGGDEVAAHQLGHSVLLEPGRVLPGEVHQEGVDRLRTDHFAIRVHL
jgi:hypothetical protein